MVVWFLPGMVAGAIVRAGPFHGIEKWCYFNNPWEAWCYAVQGQPRGAFGRTPEEQRLIWPAIFVVLLPGPDHHEADEGSHDEHGVDQPGPPGQVADLHQYADVAHPSFHPGDSADDPGEDADSDGERAQENPARRDGPGNGAIDDERPPARVSRRKPTQAGILARGFV